MFLIAVTTKLFMLTTLLFFPTFSLLFASNNKMQLKVKFPAKEQINTGTIVSNSKNKVLL